MGELNFCTIGDIIKSAHDQLISDLSLDLGLPYLVSRILHNKILSGFFHTLRCYLLYFDAIQLGQFIPLIALPLIIYAFVSGKRKKTLILIQLLIPVFFIINPFNLSLGQKINLFQFYYLYLAIIGFGKLVLSSELKDRLKNYIKRN